MKRIISLVFAVILFFTAFQVDSYAATSESVVNGKVVEADQVTEKEGLRVQTVKVEILEGEYKGSVSSLDVPLDTIFTRPISIGDKLKVDITSIGDEVYFQFYDFARARTYIWLALLFLIVIIVFLGWKGFKTLIPSILLVLFLLLGVIPDIFDKVSILWGALIVISVVSALTAWIRIRDVLLTVIVVFSVVLALLIGFIIFMGFSNVTYIVPFLGSVTTLDEDLYLKVLDLVLVSIIFLPAGGVVNASTQVVKYLFEKFSSRTQFSTGDIIKEGIRVSQKISAGELNNLIVMMVGISLAGVFLLKEQFPHVRFWDNGWVALQVIYTISAGITILLISPISVFITAAVMGYQRSRKEFGGQRRLRVGGRRRVKK
ncbi:YibE/F family protein [Candidatus Dojkabacteria bacterium]|nr:YibE/F family protein [Candidatus Dojkabacteria bacterium]